MNQITLVLQILQFHLLTQTSLIVNKHDWTENTVWRENVKKKEKSINVICSYFKFDLCCDYFLLIFKNTCYGFTSR